MARAWFGGTSDDWMMGTVAAFGATLVTLNALPVTGTCWDSETGGNQITDLLDANGSPITVLTVTGSQLPRFQGPDGVVEIWVDFGAGRILLQARDQAAAAAAARDEAQASATAAAQSETNAAGSAAAAEAVGSTNDTIIAGRVLDGTSATSAALTAAYAGRSSAVAGFVAPTFSALAPVTVVPIGVIEGVLYGADGTTLKSSTDQGATWATVRDVAAVGTGNLVAILPLADGEVLLVRDYNLLKSSGWATSPSAVTFVSVLASGGTSSFYQWGVDVHPVTGKVVATTYVGNAPFTGSRYVWLSTDDAATWSVVYDLNDHAQEVGQTNDTTHLHFARFDPWMGERLWIAWHAPSVNGTDRLLYTDNLGGTWTLASTTNRPTVGVATPAGMLFGSDELPDGVVVSRREDPTNLDQLYRWQDDLGISLGFAQWGTYDPVSGRAFIAFIGEAGARPIVIQSDGIGASLVYRAATPVDTRGDGFRAVLVDDGALIVTERRGTTWQSMKADTIPAGRTGRVSPAVDSGAVLGGSSGAPLSNALTPGASTTAQRALAAGWGALAGSTDTIACGYHASAPASGATAIGASATAAGVNAHAAGFGATAGSTSATAVGHAASATGTNGTSLGDSAAANATAATAVGTGAAALANSVSIGQGATAGASCVTVGQAAATNADLSTVVGHGATGGGAYSTVLGETASVTGVTQLGTALGRSATVASGHTRSVALGSATTTTATDQTALGPRHIEVLEVAEPAAPATNAVRVYAVDNGGQTELRARFNGGNAVTLAVQGGVTRVTPRATGSRPSAVTVGAGAVMFDTTLGKPIWSTGTAWVDATGASV